MKAGYCYKLTHQNRQDGHTENLGGRHHPGESGPHKKPAAPLTHQDDFGTKRRRQCQPRHHNNGFSWDHASTQEDDHQNNQLEQDTHKVEKLGKWGLQAINKGQQQT